MRQTSKVGRWAAAALLLVAMVGMASCTKYGGRSTPREPRAITEAPPPPSPDSTQRGTAR